MLGPLSVRGWGNRISLMAKPLIMLTMGDPAGVGPEVIVRAWRDPRLHAVARPLVAGHPEVLSRAVELTGSSARVDAIASPDQAKPTFEGIPCLMACRADAARVPPGVVDARGGRAAFDALLVATELALAGRVDAITTAPLSKAALHCGGHAYPGHTEILAELCGVRDFAMMLYLGPGDPLKSPTGLGVVHATLHTPLAEVPSLLAEDDLVAKLRLTRNEIARMKGDEPTIGVCALNPHAGEEGLFGDEEQKIIRPAVERAAAEGLQVSGPFPADTLLVRARDGEFDAVLAMYHDQGHIAIKLLGMHRAVNVTLGLPIVRTSVAHGTAFDLAWQGRARAEGMVEAVRVAARLVAAGTAARARLSVTQHPAALRS